MYFWEGIIVALDRHFVIYPRGAGVDKGASRRGRPLLHQLIYTGTPGIDDFYTGIPAEEGRFKLAGQPV